MARTRATKATKAAPTKSEPATSTSKHTLPAASSNPPKILILPNTATSDARVVSLINPRYSKPTRYLICPETGAYEFLKIAAPKTTPRSWLIEDATKTATSDEPSNTAQDDAAPFEAQVTKGADLYLATPIDPLFLVLPALAAQFTAPTKRMFLASDDHLETISSDAPHLRDLVVRWPTWRKVLESRMAVVCDTVQGPDEDENLFRFSEDKLLREVLAKARRISEGGRLPRSLEDKFVGKALEAPVLGVKRSGAPIGAAAVLKSEPSSASENEQAESQESQSSIATTATSASEASTAATSVADDESSGEGGLSNETMSAAITASAAVTALQRLRVAFSFICSSYVPPGMAAVLKRMLAENKPELADFAPLEEYVARLGKLRQEALLSRSASDYSRKRGANDEENEERAEKKRKKEEEDKRKKAGESLGVKRLKKVNTAGMQKLSAFFKPKAS